MESPINLNLTSLEQAAVHRVGNKHNGDSLILSRGEIPVHSASLANDLCAYFLKPFQAPECFRFGFSNGDSSLNPLFQFCKDIFNDSEQLVINSIHIAKHLYDLSEHPNIKPGDLFVAYFKNAVYDNVATEAVGIFKAESKQKFIQIHEVSGSLEVDLEFGINIEKLDKGCLVFNTMQEDGYRVLAIDKTNRGQEAVYWMNDFLKLEPIVNSFYQTREVMNATRQFLVQELPREVAMDRASQIDLLNKSASFFKEKEQFDHKEFEETVFQEAGLIDAYRSFRKSGQHNENEMPEEQDKPFEISGQAVKKYGKVYKSVLKLDKNFHIYIHGDRNLIERGHENDGRKFYKIYFEEES
jgi:hypothetical protein